MALARRYLALRKEVAGRYLSRRLFWESLGPRDVFSFLLRSGGKNMQWYVTFLLENGYCHAPVQT